MSAAYDVQTAIASAMLASPQLIQIVGSNGVHVGVAPANANLPYWVIGDVTELDNSRFARVGYRDTQLMHAYSSDLSGQQCLFMYGIVRKILDRKILTLDNGFQLIRARLELLSLIVDDDRESKHLISRYEAQVYEPT